MKTQFKNIFVLAALLFSTSFYTACKAPGEATETTELESESGEEGFSTPDEEQNETPSEPDNNDEVVEEETPVETPLTEDLGICSELAYEGVTWSSSLSFDDRQALLLALNISGSYEGVSGWSNLTNNFDGQGLSAGLLNQTLGTGSLQPLLYNFRRESPSAYKAVLPSSLRSKMDVMLDAWGKAKGLSAASYSQPDPSLLDEDREWALDVALEIDPLNVDKFYALLPRVSSFSAATNASVNWALNNIYTSTSGKTFKPEWKTALKNLLGHPAYVSQQLRAAETIHRRALGYQERLGFNQLRGYLMLFDIGVQNGSLAQKHFDQFFAWRRSNPSASQEAQMLQLVDIRAASSLAQWREDVKSRKKTIVHGTGYVHGENRKLQTEYCYNQFKIYPSNNSLP